MESKVENLPEIILCGYERGGTKMLSELFRSNNYESGFECGVLMCKQPYDFVNYRPYFNIIKMTKYTKIRLPMAMAFNEIKIRYARTSIGPWWQTINMLEFIQNHLEEK